MNDIENYFTVEDNLRQTIYQARMEEREEEREKHEKTIIEMIKTMLTRGADIGFISDVTKKDPEFIIGIKNSM